MSIEVPKATGPGTVKIYAGRVISIEGAFFRVESVDMRAKKVVIGVVNIDAAKAMVAKPEEAPAPVQNIAPVVEEKAEAVA